MEEGKVIFGIGLDNTSFEAQIKEAEDDLEKLEQEYSALAKAPDKIKSRNRKNDK